MKNITSMDIGKNGQDRFTILAVIPASQDDVAVLNQPGMPKTGPYQSYGTRIWMPTDSYAPLNADRLGKYAREMTERVWNQHVGAPETLNGTIDTHGLVIGPPAVGSRLILSTELTEYVAQSKRLDTDLGDFYVEGLTSSFMVNGTGLGLFNQSLAVTRGGLYK
jgi:hypothetical protein